MRVSEIRVKRNRVNQGLGVQRRTTRAFVMPGGKSFFFLFFVHKLSISPHGAMCYSFGKKYRHFVLIIGEVEKFLKSSLDSIPSPSLSVKNQIMGGKVCLRCIGKTLLGYINKLLKTKSLLTSPSNVFPTSSLNFH